MARKASSTAVVAKESTNVAFTLEAPEYLKGNEKSGLTTLGRGDYKIPRIKLLQPLNPEIRTFQGKAIPGEFWHTGFNQSLGNSFLMVPCIVSKRVVLWQPRHEGGGMLAFSRDAINWTSGKDQKFTVRPSKDSKETVVYHTKKNVQQSGLLEWGTSNPREDNSPPAAAMSYDYLVYLPDHPEMSPCVLGANRTGLVHARQFNTYMLQMNRPIYCLVMKCFADEQVDGDNVWHVSKFDPAGFATKEIYEKTKVIADQNTEFDVELEREDTAKVPVDELAY